jgi:rod shape-determining protein MreB|tara:strand:- start:2511 stop:3527 length:1017 start_codon:yes stop_codon:yes gene_type:complete
MAIDLGTTNTLVYLKKSGIVVNEPSVVAVEGPPDRIKILAVGEKAKKMLGRTPENIKAILPMKDGVIADFIAAEEMIKYFIQKATPNKTLLSPKIIICVPTGATPVERKAIQEAGIAAGARRVYLIEESMAAAIGADLPVTEPVGSMIVDVGGGTTEVAIVSLEGIVYSKSIRVGGNKFDESIISYLRRNENLIIGEVTAENVKKMIGSGIIPKHSEGKKITIKGRDAIDGIPKEKELSERQIAESLAEPLFDIVEAIKEGLEMAPPELSGDIMEYGITLTGGGSLLRNTDMVVQNATGIEVRYANDPLFSVVLGTGKVLENLKDMQRSLSSTYGGYS